MATADRLLARLRKAWLPVTVLIAILILCAGGWMVWQQMNPVGKTASGKPRSAVADAAREKPSASKTSSVPAPPSAAVPLPSSSSNGTASTETGTSAAVSAPVTAPVTAPVAASPAGGAAASSSPLNTSSHARPIVVESEGRAASLDVKTVMALQRERAERRLYDRVVALSQAGALPAGANALGLSSPTGSTGLSPQRREDTGLGTLLGNSSAAAVNRVPSGVPSGVPPLPGSASPAGTAPAIEPALTRLVSIYTRGDEYLAEMMLPNGRRVDLELDDEFMGRRVVSITESGMTFAASQRRPQMTVSVGSPFSP